MKRGNMGEMAVETDVDKVTILETRHTTSDSERKPVGNRSDDPVCPAIR